MVTPSRPIYFLLNLHGLTVLDIQFSSFAPSTDSVLLGGLVHAISTFSDSVMDNISTESGTLNVIERDGRKIMFERGKEVEAVLIAEVESMILMEKIRTIIDLFEENHLESFKETSQVVKEEYDYFSNLTRRFIMSNIDENIIFNRIKGSSAKSKLQLPGKWFKILESFDGKKSVVEVGRMRKWPFAYILTRAHIFHQLGFIKPIDISINDTDIFQIDHNYLSGILLEQGGAYQSINKTWGEWGLKVTQSIDGRQTISTLSEKFVLTPDMKKKMTHFLRWLSLQGYITLLSDSELMIIIFEEFLNILRHHLNQALGDSITYDVLELILKQDISQAKEQGRILSVGKLVENYGTSIHFEKLKTIMKSQSQIITPLFQQAFLPLLDNILRILTEIFGRKAAMEFLQQAIIETEQQYGTLVYDILFVS